MGSFLLSEKATAPILPGVRSNPVLVSTCQRTGGLFPSSPVHKCLAVVDFGILHQAGRGPGLGLWYGLHLVSGQSCCREILSQDRRSEDRSPAEHRPTGLPSGLGRTAALPQVTVKCSAHCQMATRSQPSNSWISPFLLSLPSLDSQPKTAPSLAPHWKSALCLQLWRQWSPGSPEWFLITPRMKFKLAVWRCHSRLPHYPALRFHVPLESWWWAAWAARPTQAIHTLCLRGLLPLSAVSALLAAGVKSRSAGPLTSGDLTAAPPSCGHCHTWVGCSSDASSLTAASAVSRRFWYSGKAQDSLLVKAWGHMVWVSVRQGIGRNLSLAHTG